ncbi:MAG: hypothetical protein KAT58_00720 [candidate division Zixibacteria bacterium]|nr:hypothetical protein [candidate division Zixibacteria bacterium]
MTFHERMITLDRRWIFLTLAVFVIIPFFLEFDIPVTVSKEVRDIYDFIEGLEAGDYILVGIDYDPNAMAELHPMSYAIIKQCFAKKLKVITLTLSQYGAGMAEQVVRDVADSTRIYHGFEPVYGEDYVFLGYRPYYAFVILGMGRDFRIPFPQDYYGTDLDSLPMMRGIRNYDQVECVIDMNGGTVADAWVSYGNGRYNVKLAFGLTGVMAADFYPFYQSGQIFGLMGGMKGAAEYEQLVDKPGPAKEAMKMQVFAHIVIIVFIGMANIGFFLGRRSRTKAGEVL